MKKDDKIAAAIVLRGLAKDGKFADVDDGDKAAIKSAVESAVGKVSEWLDEMIKAASEAAKGGTGGSGKIGDSGDNGVKADAGSVKEIAKGIKGIVDAAGKADGGTGGALKDVKAAEAAGDDGNADAGKLFAGAAGGNAVGAVGSATVKSAVGKVSGWLDEMIKAASEAATKGGTGDGKIGESGAAGAGKAADEDSVNGIAKGIKGIVEAAGKAADGGKGDALKGVTEAAGEANVKAGKLFGGADGGNANNANIKSAVESAVSKVSEWLDEMIKAANEAATKGGTGDGKIGDSGDNGVKAAEGSVKGIAKGIKGIVDAAGKADGGTGGALKDVKEAAGEDGNADAGKLFAGAAGGNAVAAKKAAATVSAVSGEQILKAIVEAAGEADQKGAKADAAKNPIEAAIGAAEAGAAFGDDMKKDDKIAAAIVLRGLAKGGKFAAGNDDGDKEAIKSAVGKVSGWLEEMIKAASEAAKGGTGDGKIGESGANGGVAADAGSVNEIAKGIKGIVDAAGKADGEKGGALKDVKAAAGDANVNAGKLFAGAGGNVDAEAVKKAAAAVSAVSGEQILKAIVDAAGKEGEQAGKKASDATNPIAAAIGDGEAGVDFKDNMKKRNDKIAAAIVLRGLAKDGKFAAAAGGEATIKSAVESAVGKVSEWLD
ncbi:variable large family protein [Borreliella bissettiae]|uniref:variable large family protein n=1 Tax=Borrelia bissettiae TaxID=64897 RepID=UPI00235AF1AA|nr:variable large family protein [Borreliella bissettiae]